MRERMSIVSPHLRLAAAALLLAALGAIALTRAPAAEAARACAATNAVPAKAAKRLPARAARRTIVRATLCLLNARRARQGLRPLRLSRRLSAASRRHSRHMARRNYFSHTSLGGADFVDRIQRTGYLRGARRWTVGENIAWGTGSRSTPRSIVRAWMHSSGHRANILSGSFRQIGVGVAYGAPVRGGSLGGTYTTAFGARG